MSLFQRALTNEWNKQSKRDQRLRVELDPTDEEEAGGLSAVTAAWASASDELKAVLTLLMSAPAKMLRLVLPEGADDLNETWRRLSLLKSDKDLVIELHNLLMDGPLVSDGVLTLLDDTLDYLAEPTDRVKLLRKPRYS